MATLRRTTYWEVVDAGGKVHRFGSISSPVETTVDGYVDHDTISLATGTSLTVWNSAGALTDFDGFALICDQDLKIEITCDRGGEVGLEEFVFVHPASIPFTLADNAALALYTGTLSGGTQDQIDEIVIRNESGETATIERLIVT